MYAYYKKFVLGQQPSRDLNQSIVTQMSLGKHLVQIKHVTQGHDYVDILVENELEDQLETRVWIWNKDEPGKLSFNLWRLLTAATGDSEYAFRLFKTITDAKSLTKLRGLIVNIIVKDGQGFKVNSSGSAFWLTDGISGDRIGEETYKSYNQAVAVGLKQGLKMSYLTVGQWSSDARFTNDNISILFDSESC
jgi:hypothetical protein